MAAEKVGNVLHTGAYQHVLHTVINNIMYANVISLGGDIYHLRRTYVERLLGGSADAYSVVAVGSGRRLRQWFFYCLLALSLLQYSVEQLGFLKLSDEITLLIHASPIDVYHQGGEGVDENDGA